MTTFGLVHGGLHGPWCWDMLVPELQRLGHAVVTPELPIDQHVGVDAYARVVIDALAGHGDDVVLVGHSLAGCVLPVVASQRPLSRVVFLCAIIPEPGRVLGEVASEQLDYDESTLAPALASTDDDGRLVPPSVESITESMYGDCPPEVCRWAFERMRPQSTVPLTEESPDVEWSRVPADVVVCTEDRMAPADWLRAKANDHLGVTALELPGSHSPFASRPAALADLLSGLD